MERCESLKKGLGLLLLCLVLGACGLQSRPAAPTAPTTTLDPQANIWQQLGTVVDVDATKDAQNPSIALDNSGNPTVSWSEGLGNAANVYVKRWTGSSWQQLGGALDSDINQPATNPSLALDSSGNPTVSWENYDGTSSNIYVTRWNGITWNWIGGIIESNSNFNATNPSLALDNAGNPVVSWQEFGVLNSSNIYVKHWSGSEWVQLGSSALNINLGLPAYNPSLAVDSSGNPIISWDEYDPTSNSQNVYVKRWNGSSWSQLGGALDVDVNQAASFSSLTVDSAGNPTVSWLEGTNLYVKRWNGTSWVQLGGALNIGVPQDNSLDSDSAGNPIVSWSESIFSVNNGSYSVYIKRWNGSSWVSVGGVLDVNPNENAYLPSLAVDSSGKPTVSWWEYDGNSYNVHVKRYLTNTWLDLGGALNVQAELDFYGSAIARKSNNNPVVAWGEYDGSSKNVYVKEWTGSSWKALGDALDRTLGNDAFNPSIAVRSDNRPTVAFEEAGDVFVRMWNGNSWVNVSNRALDTTLAKEAYNPSLALDSSNLPVVAYAENGNILVKKASGVAPTSTWTSPFGTTPLDTNAANDADRPSLALKSDNNPIVAWYEDVNPSPSIYANNIYAKEWNGSAWVALGGAIDKIVSKDAVNVVLAVRTDNRPVVAWEEEGDIYVKRWTGSAWVSVGGPLDKSVSNRALMPVLDLRSDNNPVVAWEEDIGFNYDVYVKRWTGSSWVQISTSAVDRVVSQNARTPALVLRFDNNPIISWYEYDGAPSNVYVRRF
jgi:hypothetical protein